MCIHASIVIYGISLWLTSIPGPQEKEKVATGLKGVSATNGYMQLAA